MYLVPPTRLAFAAAFLGTAGCLGDFPIGGDAATHAVDAGSAVDGATTGRARFAADIKPILDANCAVCHDRDGSAGPSFLRPVTYDTLLAAPGMVVSDPTASALLTKGTHEGPALTAGQAAKILQWLTVEAAHLPPPMMQNTLATAPVKPKTGPNTIDLGPLGADFAHTVLTFDAALLGATLELTQITVACNGAHGVHIVHPLFIVVSNGVKSPDPVDSFSNLDESIARGNSTALGPGTLLLSNVGALDQLSIAFHLIEKFDGGTPGGDDGGVQTGGCKDVPGFTKDAQPTLAARCIGCHGGSNNLATSAVDMTKVDDLSPAGQGAACGQVKNKIDTADPSLSLILKVTDPQGNANHPFKFNGDVNAWNSFAQAATNWITTEK